MFSQKYFIPHNNPTFKLKILDYTYTSQPSISTALPLKISKIKFILYIIFILLTFGFLWLLVKWSNKRKAIVIYNVCTLEQATHFLIEEEDVITGSKIVKREDKIDIRTKKQCLSFNYHQRVYLYHQQKQAFLPIRYQQLGIHLDQLKKSIFQPYSLKLRPQLFLYYGCNIIQLPIQSNLQVFLQQMLTPYQVFQTYAIILWIIQEYYIFSIILIIYALFTYYQTSNEVVKNQKKLKEQSLFEVNCKVLVNENQNVGAINMNDQGQVEKISFISPKANDKYTAIEQNNQNKVNKQLHSNILQLSPNLQQKMLSKNNHHHHQHQSHHFHSSHQSTSFKYNNNLSNKIKSLSISSKQIIPGDLIILNQGDIVPCDCIILKGEVLVDESYITGENYLNRKIELENFTFKRQNQKNFTMYLGTKIVKIKNQMKNTNCCRNIQTRSASSKSIQSSIMNNQFTLPTQIICLVTNTNYNTLRGKYLRAIRHQKKQPHSFTRQTIYFIYILIILTTIIFIILLSFLNHGQITSYQLFIIYLDMLSTSIPPTLPTLLSVGINFAQHRLKGYNINCILPQNILTGGKVDTIILEGKHALGKQYEVESVLVNSIINGKKKGFGCTYSTLGKFYNYYHDNQQNQSILNENQQHSSQPHSQNSIKFPQSQSLQQINKRKQQQLQQLKFSQIFINAISTCHDLQYFQGKIQGNTIQKKIFQFSQGQIIKENQYQVKNYSIKVDKKIYFKEKQKKLAVVVNINQNTQNKNEKYKGKSQRSIKNDLEQFSLLDEDFYNGLASIGDKNNYVKNQHKSQDLQQNQHNQLKKAIFIKGSAQKILSHCKPQSYPKNIFDYIVDMAQKGFSLICYAYLSLEDINTNKNLNQKQTQNHKQTPSTQYYLNLLNKSPTTFLGFLILKQIRYQDNIQAILAFKNANLNILLVSEQRQLQTSSTAILNQICTKNQLLLCSLTKNKNKIYCKGHIQWQSTQPDPLPEYVYEFNQDFGKKSKVSLTSELYEELFMRRQNQNNYKIFEKTVVFNRMEYKHQRNLYSQLEKKQKVSFAIGGGGIVSECANLSMQLERQQSSLLSSFYTNSKSLMTIFHCLRICRAGLATNFHVFSMMILFSLIQFTTICLLYSNYQDLSDSQTLYQDLFVTFPIFVTLNLTKASSKLSKQRPLTSFFHTRALISMIGQIILQFLAQLAFILYLLRFKQFSHQRQSSYFHYLRTGQLSQKTVTVISTFVLSNYLYLGIVLSTSVSKPFRKPFYTNPYYTLILILLWLYNTLIVLIPEFIATSEIRTTGLTHNQQQITILAMIYGNLMMVLMYLYENLVAWGWRKWKQYQKKKYSQNQYQNQNQRKNKIGSIFGNNNNKQIQMVECV